MSSLFYHMDYSEALTKCLQPVNLQQNADQGYDFYQDKLS